MTTAHHDTNGATSNDPRAEYERQFAAAAEALEVAIRTEATDGGEIVSLLLARVAANLGGIDQITKGRPGSWEATCVDQMLASTVGPDGEYLLEHRTEPIELVECVAETMDVLGVGYLYDEALELIDKAGEAALGDQPDEAAIDASIESYNRANELIERLREADYAAYRVAFERSLMETAEQWVGQKHLPAAVSVTVRFVGRGDRGQATGAGDDITTLEYQLWETARENTPLPGFTESVNELDAKAVLRRIPELAHYADNQANGGEA